ncbi:MAG: hypothetical protein HY811_03280 [Planctomycetes bacterium]|nr:hypothetical protein [Planctomycetota bacterium]
MNFLVKACLPWQAGLPDWTSPSEWALVRADGQAGVTGKSNIVRWIHRALQIHLHNPAQRRRIRSPLKHRKIKRFTGKAHPNPASYR